MAMSLLLGAALVAGAASSAGAQVVVDAEIDGNPLVSSTETDPIELDPNAESVLAVMVDNRGEGPVTVRTVRLEGRVVGLTFFAYDTAVGLTVEPGEQGSRRFSLDLRGLDGQATGLIPGAVKLLDDDRREVASVSGVVDVRGSLRSVYGMFGIGVAVLTLISFGGCLVGLARHRLHPNRWRRALRFATPGVGLGLLLNFTLSATGVFVPAVGRSLTIVVISAAVLFGLGYLTPAPDLRSEDDLAEEELERVGLPAAQPSRGPAVSAAAANALRGPASALPKSEPERKPAPELGPETVAAEDGGSDSEAVRPGAARRAPSTVELSSPPPGPDQSDSAGDT